MCQQARIFFREGNWNHLAASQNKQNARVPEKDPVSEMLFKKESRVGSFHRISARKIIYNLIAYICYNNTYIEDNRPDYLKHTKYFYIFMPKY